MTNADKKEHYYVLALGGHYCPYCEHSNDDWEKCNTLQQAERIKKRYIKRGYSYTSIVKGIEVLSSD